MRDANRVEPAQGPREGREANSPNNGLDGSRDEVQQLVEHAVPLRRESPVGGTGTQASQPTQRVGSGAPHEPHGARGPQS